MIYTVGHDGLLASRTQNKLLFIDGELFNAVKDTESPRRWCEELVFSDRRNSGLALCSSRFHSDLLSASCKLITFLMVSIFIPFVKRHLLVKKIWAFYFLFLEMESDWVSSNWDRNKIIFCTIHRKERKSWLEQGVDGQLQNKRKWSEKTHWLGAGELLKQYTGLYRGCLGGRCVQWPDIILGTGLNKATNDLHDSITRTRERSIKSIYAAYRRQWYQEWKSISITRERGA